MAKMFVHYSKTKAEFISAGLATTYNDSIVFIKGDASGNGSCIYTHGQYFANFSEFLAAINYVKGITVNGQSYNAAAGGGYVAFEASDPSTVAVNTSQSGVSIGLTEAFVKKVNDTATNLGSKGDAASADGSAFARIANLAARLGELTGDEDGGQSIAAQINALRTEIVGTLGEGDSATLEAINDELDSLVANSNSLYEGLEEIRINDKAVYNRTDGATPITLAGTDIKVGGSSSVKDSTVEAAIASHQSAIDTLNGTGAGSVSKQVADAIAGVVNSAPEDFDTLKEIADYIASDKTNATQINNDLSAIKNYSVNGKKFSAAEDGAVTIGAGDVAYSGTANDYLESQTVAGALDAAEASFKTMDTNKQEKITDLETIRSGAASGATAYQKPSAGIPKTDLASAVQTSLGKADAAAPQATTYTKAEVDAMWEWEEL
ncbi:MAG: hypothetical protein J6B41_07345 [Alistipes sp.]|nr:hypothetical protein [Alistipes sp.]